MSGGFHLRSCMLPRVIQEKWHVEMRTLEFLRWSGTKTRDASPFPHLPRSFLSVVMNLEFVPWAMYSFHN